MSDFYTNSNDPYNHASGSSAVVRAEFAAIAAAFEKLAAYTGANNLMLHVNATGNGYETTVGLSFDGSTFLTPAMQVTSLAGTGTRAVATDPSGNLLPSGDVVDIPATDILQLQIFS